VAREEHERDPRGYLDGARAYDARVAFPDVLLADELTLGIAGLRRLAGLRETASPLPVVLLTDFPMTSVTDEEVRASLHVAAVLRRPYTRHQLARTMAGVLPAPYPDEAARRS
jgi:hypothetical protein